MLLSIGVTVKGGRSYFEMKANDWHDFMALYQKKKKKKKFFHTF